MFKTIVRETLIVILILIAIILVLGILFYDHIPTSKVVPVKIQSYDLPDDIQEELKESVSGEENIVTTYRVDDRDLDLYESNDNYDKGKANPFVDYSQETTNTNTSSNTNGNGNNVNTNAQNNVNNNITQNNVEGNSDKEVYFNTSGKQ